MNVFKLVKKYPQIPQHEIMSIQAEFNRQDVDDKSYLEEGDAIKAAMGLERQTYDVVRAALKNVELDSSRRVELEDFVDVCPAYSSVAPKLWYPRCIRLLTA